MTESMIKTPYSAESRKYIGLLDTLRSFGAHADLDLPGITVIGNQSAGKSSLVEAITGIQVPRDPGTCTRVPLECRMVQCEEPWSMRVTLRLEFDGKGARLYPGNETPFGDKLTNNDETGAILKKAQLACLHPDVPINHILNASDEALKEACKGPGKCCSGFSKNTLCVDIRGSDVVNLSFIDLPGLIQNASADAVKLVEDMAVSSIRGNCLILVTLPMTDDIQNQKAVQLALAEDPLKQRTIGVLTKPDMLINGATKAVSLWREVLEGRSHPLKHGYYCTRQLNDAERDTESSTSLVRDLEAKFFKNTPPWSTMPDTSRLGIPNLINSCSQLLVAMLKESIPNISKETQILLNATRRELRGLPPISNEEPTSKLLRYIMNFSNKVQHFARGGPEHSRLIRGHRDAYEDLKEAVKATAPRFTPFSSAELKQQDQELEEGVIPSNLTTMRQYLARSITRELPDNIPFKAKVVLIIVFQQSWEDSVFDCLDRVRDLTQGVINECVDQDFAEYSLLSAQLKSFVRELIEKHYDLCVPFLDTILEAERNPFTNNDDFFRSLKADWLSRYREIRSSKLANSSCSSSASVDFTDHSVADGSLHRYSPAKLKGGKPSVLNSSVARVPDKCPESNPRDEYEVELDAMAEVRGYFEVAYQRVIDYGPSFIDVKFLKGVAEELQSFLVTKFKLGTESANEHCAKFLTEDADVAIRRSELLAKEKRLVNVMRELDHFGSA